MTCFQIFRRRKLAIRFRQDVSSSNELIGYVELTERPERNGPNVTWTMRNKTVSAFFFKSNTTLVAASERNTFAFFLILELDRSIKRKPIGIRGNAHTLWEIDVLWLTLCSYISSEITFDTRLIRRNGDLSFCVYWLPSPYQWNNNFYRILHLITFLSIYRLLWFLKMQRAYDFFSGRHPRRFGVTLITVQQRPKSGYGF